MTAPLLETKLHLPGVRPGRVPRPQLCARLDGTTAAKLTLVSAPPGFGKTTLLAQWLGQRRGAAAWLSLDPSDNDPATFWGYFVAALGRLGRLGEAETEAPVGASVAVLLQESQPPPIEAVLTALINELDTLGTDVVLVLDDYHVIDAPAVHDQMTFLLDHLPPRLHLVIASRVDPVLPLARLRARGELVEVRAADLRFTPEEAASYLTEVMGLPLTAADVAALEGRTEGWIAALQLAALSLQGRDDVTGFIAGFTGDDRYIVDYLADEVLQRQPEDVRSFLLQTSILGRLSGPLCDAVTGQHGGRASLERLDRANLFLVPLDDRREWYRYHHLFADVLRTRLSDEQPSRVPELHRRASEWYRQRGEWSEAVGHALAGGHFERAAELVELAMPALLRERREAVLLGWLERLPDEVVRVRPLLANGYAGVLLATGEAEGVEQLLRTAERGLDATTESPDPAKKTSSPMVVVDDAGFRRLPADVAIHRAGLALMEADPTATLTHARRAFDLLAEDDDLGRGAAAALVGLASWTSGDLETALASYADSAAALRRAGHLSDVLGCTIAMADLRVAMGRLREATRDYELGLRLAPEDGPVLRGTADMYVGLSALHYERNDLPAAAECLRRSEELGEQAGLPQNRYRWRVAMAQIRQAEGDLDAALDLLEEAERLYIGDFSPDVRPVPAMMARLWIRQGRVDDALGWARARDLSPEPGAGALGYQREFEYVTLARALLTQHSLESAERPLRQAVMLLERLLPAAEMGHRGGSVLEILVLLALAHRLGGDLAASLVMLQRALTLAEPEGYVRLFLDEGRPLATLLEAAVKRRIPSRYGARLLAGFGRSVDRAEGSAPSKTTPQAPVDPLSHRERDVLRLLRTELTGPEIARELVVSLSTVRTHTQRIYAKLGVTNRRAAVRRARELGL